MFFIAVIVLLVLYHQGALKAPSDELWFMIAIFAGLAYVAGFLDSRIFARFDKQNANRLAEAEARYEQRMEGET